MHRPSPSALWHVGRSAAATVAPLCRARGAVGLPAAPRLSATHPSFVAHRRLACVLSPGGRTTRVACVFVVLLAGVLLFSPMAFLSAHAEGLQPEPTPIAVPQPPGEQPTNEPGGLPFSLPDPKQWAADVFNQVLINTLQAIAEALRGVVGAVMGSSLNFITQTPPAGSYGGPTVQALWGIVRAIANAALALVALWGGFNLIFREQIGSPYHEAMELLPRLALGALLANTKPKPRMKLQRALQPSRAKHGFLLVEPKTKRNRRTVVAPSTMATLKERRRRQMAERPVAGSLWTDMEMVFTTPTGGPLNATSTVMKAFCRALERAGPPHIRLHNLRHTAATLLLGEGVNPKYVQAFLGHGTIVLTLDTYSHVTPMMHDQAAEKMETLFGNAN